MQYPYPRITPNDLSSRVLELELSQELHDIYSHPLWINFMTLLSNAKCDASRHELRQWAESHYQLGPLIQWFHHCTRKYGLCFDVYSFIPPSRLILLKKCRERVSHYKEMLCKCERKLAYYHELEKMLYEVAEDSANSRSCSDSPESSLPTSCWSILTSHTLINVDQYRDEPSTAYNAQYQSCDRRRNTKCLPPLPPLETLDLPEAATVVLP